MQWLAACDPSPIETRLVVGMAVNTPCVHARPDADDATCTSPSATDRSAPRLLEVRPRGPVRRLLVGTTSPARAAAIALAGGYIVTTLLVLLVGLLITRVLADSSLVTADVDLSRWLERHRTPWADRTTQVVSTLGDTLGVVGFVVVTGGLLALRHRWREAMVIVVGLTVELAVFLSTTWVVGRERPPVVRIDSTPSTASFPSGHVAAAVVIWGALAAIAAASTTRAIVRVGIWLVPIAFATAMAGARMYRGMHFASDTVAGGLLGVAALAVAVAVMRALALIRRRQ